MHLWFTEEQTAGFGITAKIKKTLYHEQTPYQVLDMVETETFGPMLVLDGMVMTTVRDEFVYHEMISHIPLFAHPNPRRVLIIGGGDGGVLREVLRHSVVERAVMVEIDSAVVEVSKAYLPQLSSAFTHPRAEVHILDGFRYLSDIAETRRVSYDVIIVDSTEPVGPAEKLFERGFYQAIFDALSEDGLFVAQTDNPWFKGDLIRRVSRDIAQVFPRAFLYTANIPTYPSGLWTFTIGSKVYDPRTIAPHRVDRAPFLKELRYYHPALQEAAFVLPRFVSALVEGVLENGTTI
ncbi:MAG: Spermidine synthase [Candidatus Carbobacillus altaicus]|uniref:Polyamine aminopropyltransferase n=1 Tax=Candidatus Carbonibacillus altaicus TaxID=2163959 RepID=A0A2R6Y427_9BACL|nr:MAG: Spermidine synthase [Candidatus Carbobacillus altaicus]